MEIIYKSVASAILAYSTNYGIAKFYNYACVHDGIWGFMNGFITMGSPVCQTSINLLQSTQLSYSSLLMSGISRAVVDVVANIGFPLKA